ncbi:MAG TPA: type I-E CRISPR-associated protein Cas6/Cse3/CasE [Gemmatimonas sp.]|uniref:type I-E CRISPR-associated protein Cas6/Cse3/CasE n=1 Tax=Gemmatimonas sp. TaxID=1962908 RepID=UPI002ED852CC
MSRLLTKLVLRDDPPVAAIRALLRPDGDGPRTAAGHHLMWSLFADSPDRKRDFLWREHRPGEYYVVADRAPEDRLGLFDVWPARHYDPRLVVGDRLEFELRVNATVSRSMGRQQRGVRSDVLMHAIHGLDKAGRSEARRERVQDVARVWMSAQGDRAGYELETLDVQSYNVWHMPRREAKDATFGVLDVRGVLRVRDPEPMRSALFNGLGRAKAFGCGLMLVRRS